MSLNSFQPETETHIYCPSTMLASEDSEEETSQEELPITSWNELSIIERVGLNSVEMSEKDLEAAFSQIALAFRCDQYTLKQRLQAEEHDRNLAEENIQLELTRGRETLEALKVLCLDSKRSKILQRLELSLDILAGTVERISNTAEVLGAVHQEARVSRAVELMVAHVDNLRRQHARNAAELEEAKKAIQQQSCCRNFMDPGASPEPGDGDSRKKNSHRNSIRRRVSISLISIKTQEKIMDLKKRDSQTGSSSKNSCLSHSLSFDSSCSAMTKQLSHSVDDRPMDPDEAQSEASAAQLPPQSSQNPNPECLLTKRLSTRNAQKKSSTVDTLRQRHKGKSVISKRKTEKDKKKIYKHLSAGTFGSLWRRCSLAHRLYRCRWLILCISLFVLFCVITMTSFLLGAL